MDSDSRPMAPYMRIATQIIRRITSGDLQPGDHIPSVSKIMETERVSRATAARVASVLRAEGYAESVQGVGTVVTRPKRLNAGAHRLTMVRAGGTGLDGDERTEILGAELEPAAQEIADALGLGEGAEVIRRRRRYIDGRGVATVSTTWIAGTLAEVAPELLGTEPLPTMTFGLIEERTGRRAVKRRDTVSIREAPEDIAQHLEVPPGTHVLTMTNHYSDQNGEPTEYAVDYHGLGRELSSEYNLEAEA
ncbi:GntR family transcriptional regulator [Streptomyces scabiei]|uniref:GntR family transcriptional regulator n=1 Tax=Streptomyces scabiei TaxID=1930 RepID=UPI00298FD3FF|nr:GntR family transcriptional regulator [Streptomyces scabiei]MDW8807731.1 GntR family transcriptional regulator [Streptomyces scabiei]